jgi:hypothetical protein
MDTPFTIILLVHPASSFERDTRCPVNTVFGIGIDTPFTIILLGAERDTPCTFILVVERDTRCQVKTVSIGINDYTVRGRKGYTLHVHTAAG